MMPGVVTEYAELALESAAPRETWRNTATNIGWTTAGNVTYAASQFTIVLLLARLGTPTMVAQYAVAQSVVLPLLTLSQLQLRSVQATDTRRVIPFGRYLCLRLISTAAFLVVVAATAFLIAKDTPTCWIVVLYGVGKAMESVSDVYFGRLQAIEHMDRIGKSQIGRGILMIASTAVLLLLTGSIELVLLALAAISLVVLLAYDRFQPHLSTTLNRADWSMGGILALTRSTAVLGLSNLFVQLNAYIPRIALYRYSTPNDLASYSAISAVQPAGMILVMALGQATIPRLARAYARGARRDFVGVTRGLAGFAVAIGTLAVSIAVLGGDALVIRIFGSQYRGNGAVLFGFSIYAAFLYCSYILTYPCTAAGRTGCQAWASALMAGVTGLLCAVAVPGNGAKGAALAAIPGAVLCLIVYLINIAAASRSSALRKGKPQ